MTYDTYRKWGIALFFLLGTTLVIKLYSLYSPWGLRIVVTPSIPEGIYASERYTGTPLNREQTVCFKPQELAWMAGRGYFAPKEIVCKYVLGIPGDRVEVNGTDITICHDTTCKYVGPVQQSDKLGRPSQAAFMQTTTIPAGYYFLGSYHPRSFDSRYLGLIAQSAIDVQTWPIWTR